MLNKIIQMIKGCEGCNRRRQKLDRWFMKRKLIRHYQKENEANKLMEEFTTNKILNGGSQEYISKGRSELIELQNQIKETTTLIDFLRSLKK